MSSSRAKGACLTCHRVRGEGPAAAPDLTDIGALRTPSALQLTLIDPSGVMLPLNRPIRAVTKDGRMIRGRRLNEDTYTVQLIDDRERLIDAREEPISASTKSSTGCLRCRLTATS